MINDQSINQSINHPLLCIPILTSLSEIHVDNYDQFHILFVNHPPSCKVQFILISVRDIHINQSEWFPWTSLLVSLLFGFVNRGTAMLSRFPQWSFIHNIRRYPTNPIQYPPTYNNTVLHPFFINHPPSCKVWFILIILVNSNIATFFLFTLDCCYSVASKQLKQLTQSSDFSVYHA